MRDTFLDVEARLRTEFVHPGGERATWALLDVLAPVLGPGRRALELGCGTGATTSIVARTTGTRIVGLDRSPLMLRVARERGAGGPALVRADASAGLPFANAVFDALYAESVVALLEAPIVIAECARVLRPGGLLAFNERIWKPGIAQALADEINAYSTRAFGIPAATRAPLDHVGWSALLIAAGFADVRAAPLRAIVPPSHNPQARRQRLDRMLRQLARPTMLLQEARFARAARQRRAWWDELENYLFFAYKPDDQCGMCGIISTGVS